MSIFDATQVAPVQTAPTHPVGKFPAFISGAENKPTKDNSSGYLEIMFTTQAGKIPMRYNLWHEKEQVARIAQGQLSALCHATGVMRVDVNGGAKEFLNAQCQIEVTMQADGKYTQVSYVYDIHGNEPTASGYGKAPASAASAPPFQQAPAPAQAPPQQQPYAAPAQAQQQAFPNPGASPPGWPPAQQPQAGNVPAQAPFQQAPAQAPMQQQAPAGQPPWQPR